MKCSRTIVVVFSLHVAWPTVGQAQEVRWLHDLNAAKAEAKAKNRPLLLDFGTVNCYWCKQLDATTFCDPSITKLLTERFVAVKMDASKDPALAQSMGVNAFPTLIFMAPDGKVLGRHEGYVDANRFQAQLMKAATTYSTDAAAAPVAAKAKPVATPMTRFVLPTPEQLGIGMKLYPLTLLPEPQSDPATLFVRLREVGAVAFHVERMSSGYRARITLPGPQNQGVTVEGSGPDEGAAIAAALGKVTQ